MYLCAYLGLHDYQCDFEVYLRYLILWLKRNI